MKIKFDKTQSKSKNFILIKLYNLINEFKVNLYEEVVKRLKPNFRGNKFARASSRRHLEIS